MKHIFIFLISTILALHPIDNMSTLFQETITNPERTDGFGAQFQTIIYAVIYAELTNKKYVYTPFKSMEHNYDNNANYLAQKEWLINFINNFEHNNNEATITTVSSLITFFESNLTVCSKSESLKKIKRIFRENKESNRYFNRNRFTIAVHIRRPNTHDSRLSGADTPDTLFLDIIRNLRVIYTDKDPLFHLYSQGATESFKAFESNDVILHLNDSVEDTFIPMVYADVLVTSPSSLSYTAGILSEGVVYYIPFWHPPLPHWMPVDTLCSN